MADPNVPLPLHIEETIRSIARLHAEHHQNTTPLQRAVDRSTAFAARPRFIGILTIIAAAWISLNLLTAALGYRPIDPPPFSGLEGALSLVSLYMVERWLGLFEQIFRFDKWNPCRGDENDGPAERDRLNSFFT